MEEVCLILTGHYGSGKTELALQKAIDLSSAERKTYLCDLDVINPYFRSRDYELMLNENNIELVAPAREIMKADIPIVTGEVTTRIKDHSAQVILDVGGDEDGATVLGQFSDIIKERAYDFLFVVNINRPHVADSERIINAIRAVESSSRLKVNGLVNNYHLGGEPVTAEDIQHGADMCRQVEDETGIPFKYSMVEEEVYTNIKESLDEQETVVFQRKLLTPWQIK